MQLGPDRRTLVESVSAFFCAGAEGADVSRKPRGRPGRVGARGCVILLACIGVALALGVVALSASVRAPSFTRSLLGTDDSVSAAIGDLNGDGRADIATANYNPASVSVGLNRGGGRFEGGDYEVGGLARWIAIGELDGDGKPDLVTTLEGEVRGSDIPFGFSVLINQGDGQFSPRRDYETDTKPLSMALEDLNGDKRADLALGLGETVSVLINRGDGTFLSPVAYTIGGQPRSLEAGDLNGDAKPDLVAVAGASSIAVLLNRDDGSFEAKQNYRSGRTPTSIAIGDLNADRKPDLAVSNFSGNTVSVLLNRGEGSFESKHDYRTGVAPSSIVFGDFNGDGTPDLATANSGPGTVAVLLNRGDGSLRTKLDYVPEFECCGPMTLGDVNGDRRPDLAVPVGYSRNGSTYLSLLINTPGLCNVQNVVGMTLSAAKRTLARISCRVGKVRHAYSKGMKRGRVISTKPWFGAVRPKGTKVNLVVSKGRRR
jgi:FG-GAP-like repeat/PASTA domain